METGRWGDNAGVVQTEWCAAVNLAIHRSCARCLPLCSYAYGLFEVCGNNSDNSAVIISGVGEYGDGHLERKYRGVSTINGMLH